MHADNAGILKLLKTARGQLDGLVRMVEEDRYCVDISNQLMATQSILKKANSEILSAHMDGCINSALKSDDVALRGEKLAEIKTLVEKLSK